MHDDKGPCGVCFKHIPSDWTKKWAHHIHGIWVSFETIMVSLNWCNHLLTFVHVDILNGTKNTVPPKWQTTHFLALSSTGHNFWLFMLPGIISCQPCHSKCPCHITRHLQLHRAPHGTLRAQRVPAHRGNEFLSWSRSAIRAFGWVRITLNAKSSKNEWTANNDHDLHLYDMFGANCLKLWHVFDMCPFQMNTFQQSTVTIFRLAMSHPFQKQDLWWILHKSVLWNVDFPAEICGSRA